jgi:hypothetical protein
MVKEEKFKPKKNQYIRADAKDIWAKIETGKI